MKNSKWEDAIAAAQLRTRAANNAMLMYHTLKACEKRITELIEHQGLHHMDSELRQIKDVLAEIEGF